MKASELRIGNLFRDKFKKNEIMKVYKLDHNIHFDSVFKSDRIWFAEPIPLTEEWLLKFGFESNPYQDRYELKDFYIYCNKTEGFLDLWVLNCKVDLKHVDQLQNLYFALTGKELKYENRS